jgi:hypothetical protein
MNVLFPSFLKQQSLHTPQEVDFGADGKRGDRECDTEHEHYAMQRTHRRISHQASSFLDSCVVCPFIKA